MKPSTFISPSVLLALAAFAQPLQAATILSDTFSDGDRADGADPQDSQWRLLTNIAPTTAAVVSGALYLERTTSTSVGFNPHAVTNFASQTLSVGQTITLSVDFQSLGSASASGIRFGLFNSGGTNLSGDLAANPPPTGTVFQNDLGYSVFAPHQGTGTQSFGLYSRAANVTNNTLQLATGANALISNAGSLTTPTNTATIYNASLSLTRTLTGYDYEVGYAGASFTGSTAVVTTSTFDSLSIFGITGQNQALTLDNVTVSVIPEPASLALAGLGAVGLALRRRRHS